MQSILVTGATGYVGGRLVPALVRKNKQVRCLARRPDAARARFPQVEVVGGDLLAPDSLGPAFTQIDTAFYLVHALGEEGSLWETETSAARNFAQAARLAGVRRIVYLGGLLGAGPLSPHLATRQAVGEILRESGVPTIEFRASIILGSGSLSFEMIRALVERLPVMIVPRWVNQLAQPIAIEDVIAYLVAAVELPEQGNLVVEIGGRDRVSYQDLMIEYGRLRGLNRLMIPVPVLTPRLSSLWLALITPVYARSGRRLIESVRHHTIVTSPLARQLFPDIQPRGMQEAMERALLNEDSAFAQTRWSDPLSARGPVRNWHGVRFGWRRVDSRALKVDVSAERAFAPIARIGGTTGWYYGNALWRVRGLFDLLVGGAGMRRGRRHPELLGPGDTLDAWRVEACVPNRLLRLHAEMRLPGRAWLQFEVTGDRPAVIRQTATFDPIGLLGVLYWYALYPLHSLLFTRMLHGIARAALQRS
jgi:uncharacterized protein YbjT (DUF2867 family)